MAMPLVIFGSSRRDGDTKTALDLVMQGQEYELVDLQAKNISPFDYEHANAGDDFLPLVEKMLTFDTIILATPVYWYAVSAQMKTFIDRFSDLLTIAKDLGAALAGKRIFVVCAYGTEFPLGCASFEVPLRMTCDYMNIIYGGCYFHFSGQVQEGACLAPLEDFRARLKDPTAGLAPSIKGQQVTLRLATMGDRRSLFTWMYESDASRSMFGAPLFPEKPAKSWEDFKKLWDAFYYQKPLTSRGHVFVIEHAGEDVGGIAFHRPDAKNRSELDIWLRSEADCGKGIGSDAMLTLCRHLYRELGIMFFWLMPSARNPRSLRAYEKIGFRRLPLSAEEGKAEFGFQDYHDSVYLLKDMSLEVLP